MEEMVNKCYLAIPSSQHHSDPTGWNLAVWNGWRGLTKFILLEDPKYLGPAMLLDMPFLHLLKLTRIHGPASLLGLGDITSAWSPNPLSVASKCWLSFQPLLVTLHPWDLAFLQNQSSTELGSLSAPSNAFHTRWHESLLFLIYPAPYALSSVTQLLCLPRTVILQHFSIWFYPEDCPLYLTSILEVSKLSFYVKKHCS